MEQADYKLAWALYLGAGIIFMLMVWWFTRRHIQRDLAFIIQGFFAVLIFTPWYVYPDQDYLAPALMVSVMDAITVSPSEGFRGLVPLVMASVLALVVSLGRSLGVRILSRRRKDLQKQAEDSEQAGLAS